VLRAVWGLFAIHLVIRVAAFGSAYFLQDDFVLQGQAARRGMFTTDYLLHVHSDHLMPAGYLVAGVAEWLSPLNYWVVLLTLIPLQVAASWLTVRLLLSLFGHRWLVLAPVAVALFSPLTLPSSVWWAAALNLLPVQAAGAASAWAALTLLRTGRRRWGAASMLALVVGLTFDNKAAMVPVVVLVVLWVAVASDGGLVRSLVSVLRRYWALWLAFAFAVGTWLAAYLSLSDPIIRDVSESTEVVRSALITSVEGFVPAVMGGPLAWASVAGSGSAYASPPIWFTVVSIHVLLALVLWGSINSAAGRRAWVGVGTYVGLDLLLLAIGRSGLVETIGLNLRYTADSIVLVAVAVGASVMAPVGHDEGRLMGRVRVWAAHRPGLARGAGIGLVYLYLVPALVSHVTILGHLADNDSREWLANVRQSVDDVGGAVAVLDTGVPANIYWGLGFPYNQISWILAPIDGVRVVPAVTELARFDPQGRLRAAEVDGTAAAPGPDGSCGWEVGPDGAQVRLDGAVFPWRYVMRIGYFTSRDTAATVRLGDGAPVVVPFDGGGLREVFVDIEGGGQYVTFSRPDDDVRVCVDLEVGDAVVPSG